METPIVKMTHRALTENRYEVLKIARIYQPLSKNFVESYYFNQNKNLGKFYLMLNEYIWENTDITPIYAIYLDLFKQGWIFTQTRLENKLLDLFLRELALQIQSSVSNDNPVTFFLILDELIERIYDKSLNDFKKQGFKFNYVPSITEFKKQVDKLRTYQLLNKKDAGLVAQHIFSKQNWNPNDLNNVFSFPCQYSLINVPSVELHINSMALYSIVQMERKFQNSYTLRSRNAHRHGIVTR